MGKTFVQLKADLGDWLGVNAAAGDVDSKRLVESIRGDIINMVIRDALRQHDLTLGELTDTFATADGTATYVVPATWSRPVGLWYAHPDTGDPFFLDHIDSKNEFDNQYPDPAEKDLPEKFTVFAGNFYLGPTPDRILTINRNFWGFLADLTGSGTNVFTDKAWDYILFASCVKATMFGIEDRRVPTWEKEARRILDNLVVESERSRSSDRRHQSEEPG